jgi:transcription antitermination factor NusG
MTIWAGYAKAGREFAVQADIEALGMSAWVARQINAKRVPTSRVAVAVIAPYLPNYVFIECSDDQWHRLREVKHLASTLAPIAPRVAREYLDPFRAQIDAAFAERQEAISAGAAVAEYNPGDLLQIMAGPLAGHLATFRKLAETDHDLFPRIRADVELFGRTTTIDIDPINARRA